MPKGIYVRMIEDKNNFTIPSFAQKLMDSNYSCCFNCIYFKLLKHGGVYSLEEYKNLKANCVNIKAIKEREVRRRTVDLRIFFHDKTQYPRCRVNCKYFELV